MQMPTPRLLVLFAAPLLAASAALAQSDGQCAGVQGVPMTEAIAIARVVRPNDRLHFVHASEPSRRNCPDLSPGCRARAFLVPGDVVLTLPAPHKGYLCASFVDRKGTETTGWLPTGALAPVPAKADDEAEWVGRWRRTEAAITIARGKQGGLMATGEATWGAGDRRRVAEGGVNIGAFGGAMRRTGETRLVADNDVASFERAPQDRCAVRLRRIGPYLLVEDNMACGGMNVSFSGLYVR
jgi:hypothetical protein